MTQQSTEARGAGTEQRTGRLRTLAFWLLGSVRAADDAVREAPVAVPDPTSSPSDVGTRSTMLVAALCLDVLRARESYAWHVPDLVVADADEHPPRDAELLDGSIGAAPRVALEALSAEERVAYVLHDHHGVSFGEIGDLLGMPAEPLVAAGRERVRAAPTPSGDLAQQRRVVADYFRAASAGDVDAVMALLHDDAVVRADAGVHAISDVVTDHETIARRVVMFRRLPGRIGPALVDGAAGAVAVSGGQVTSVVAATVVGDRIAEMDVLHGPTRLAGLDLSAFVRNPADPSPPDWRAR